MSGLAAVLAGHTTPDLYRWTNATDVPDVRHAVEHVGWVLVHVDGWTLEDRAGFLAAAATALGADPAEVDNFDALGDHLDEVPSGDTPGVVVLWDGWSPLARHDEQAFRVALSVLGARVNSERGAPFVVLLRGEGPALDLAELPVRV